MSRLNTVTVSALALTLALSLSACTHASENMGGASGLTAANTEAIDKIPVAPLDPAAAALLPSSMKAGDVINVGTDPTFPPYEYYGSDNKTVEGWDADFAVAIGQTLGLKVKMVPSTFDAILPGLVSKRYDVGMSAFSSTPERQKNADFVNYLDSGSGLAVQPNNPKKLSMDPMSLCGTKSSGQKGTTQGIEILPEFSAACVKAGKAPINIQLFPSQNEANLALISGRVDSIMSDSISLAYQGKLSNGKFELAKGSEYEPTPTGVALAKGSDLTPAFMAAVKKLVQSDTYKAINAKYGIPDSVTVTPAMVEKSMTP